MGADISRNDVSCSNTLVNNIEKNLYKLKNLGARDAAVTNVTGDDVVNPLRFVSESYIAYSEPHLSTLPKPDKSTLWQLLLFTYIM